MLDKIGEHFKLYQNALGLRSYRTAVIAGNISNGDTPYYKAVDFDFQAALLAKSGRGNLPRPPLSVTNAKHFGPATTLSMALTNPRHMQATAASEASGNPELHYRSAIQPSLDGNTVDMNKERSAFLENALNYQSTLAFVKTRLGSLTTAITGN